MIKDHQQFNLSDIPENQNPQNQDWIQSGNVVRTDKTLNIKNRFIVNDFELQMKLGQSVLRRAVSTLVTGFNVSVTAYDFIIGITSLSYSPAVILPKPSMVGEGKTYLIKDEAGGAATTTITIRSDAGETIDGAASATIATNYGFKSFYTDGASWFTNN